MSEGGSVGESGGQQRSSGARSGVVLASLYCHGSKRSMSERSNGVPIEWGVDSAWKMISPSCCDVKGTDFGLAARAEGLRDSVCEASEAVEVARSRPGHTMLALFLLFDTDDRFLDEDIDLLDLVAWRSSRCLRLEVDQQSEYGLSYAMEAYLKSRIACDRTFLRVVSSWPPEEPLTFTNSSMAAGE